MSRFVEHTLVHAMKDVEEQRLDQRRIRPHRIEVEDLQPLERERVFDVVEEVGVPASFNPLLEPRHQRLVAAGSRA